LPVGGRVGVLGGGAHVHHRCRRGALDGRFRVAAGRARLRHTPDAPPRVETDRTETISRRSRGAGRPGHPVVASPSRAGRSAWFVPLGRSPSGVDEGEAGERPPGPSTPHVPALSPTGGWERPGAGRSAFDGPHARALRGPRLRPRVVGRSGNGHLPPPRDG